MYLGIKYGFLPKNINEHYTTINLFKGLNDAI